VSNGPVSSFVYDFRGTTTVRWQDQDGRDQARSFTFEPETISTAAAASFPAVFADWMELAFAAHLADRLSPRRALDEDGSGLQWRRRITIVVPVRNLEFWGRLSVRTAVERCLGHLTGDAWTIEFCGGRGTTWKAEVQQHFPVAGAPSDVMLFSGGLDSLAGAAHLATRNRDLVLVSGVPNPRHGAQQHAQIAALRRTIAPRVVRVPVTYGIELDADVTERAQRARAFLHLTLGCVTALLLGQTRLHVAENGVGAINLPLDGTQLGTSNARATHPTFLLQMQTIAQLVAERDFEIVNPFQFFTKGEACRDARVHAVAEVIGETFSCDGFPVRAKERPQCGFCTACVLRRLAIEVAGLQAWDNHRAYLRDICSFSSTLPRHVKHGVLVMELQARILRACLDATRPWLALIEAYPELERSAQALARLMHDDIETCRARLVRLYRQHVIEWQAFSARPLVYGHAA
jgi:7-cyano-7-deazaguanine synthase in queuosine biosynthesis